MDSNVQIGTPHNSGSRLGRQQTHKVCMLHTGCWLDSRSVNQSFMIHRVLVVWQPLTNSFVKMVQ